MLEGGAEREERDRGRERSKKFSMAGARAWLAPWEGPGTLRLWVGHQAGPRHHCPLCPCLAIGFYQHQGDSLPMPGSDARASKLKVNTSWPRRRRRGPELGPSGVPLPWPDGRPRIFLPPFPHQANLSCSGKRWGSGQVEAEAQMGDRSWAGTGDPRHSRPASREEGVETDGMGTGGGGHQETAKGRRPGSRTS